MDTRIERPSREGSILIGVALVVVGVIGLLTTWADIDPSQWLGGSGWTLFLIVPGVLLLAGGLATTQPAGQGVTIAGSVVTTLGVMMLVMDRTETWNTWAFAWALIPLAAGVGLVLHGLRTDDQQRVGAGLRLAAVSAALFLAGAWYFGTLFQTGNPPIELGDAWPLVLVVIGVVVIAVSLLRRPTGPDAPTG